jgi:hypothetical protein
MGQRLKHEELQLKVYQIYKYNDADDQNGTANWVDVDKALLSLLSVVALHSPEVTDGLVWCTGCDATQLYPCQTLRIIVKDLFK